MRFITVTSDNYVAATARMVASLRQWHADDPVVVYALEQDWNPQLEQHFDGMQLQVRHLPEQDKRYRQGTLGQSVFARWKLDVFLDQQEPFIFLDSDTLILRPLHELIKQTLELGWFTVNEGTTLGQYAQGDISHHVELPDHDESRSGFNTGVVGCDPEGHREVFELAAQWAAKIKGNLLGDQGLLNLAWYELHGDLPPGQSSLYNGGWHTDDTMNLSQAILHFARPNYTTEQKLHDHHRIWEAWPRGIALTPLVDSAFWRESLPQPWTWLNHCVQQKHKDFVRNMRQQSRTKLDPQGLIVTDRWQAFLIDEKVLNEARKWWLVHAAQYRGLPHQPTFHLIRPGRVRSLASCAAIRSIDRLKSRCT